MKNTVLVFMLTMTALLGWVGPSEVLAQYANRGEYQAPLEPITGILHGAGQQIPENPGFHEYVALMAEGKKPAYYMHYFSMGDNSDNNCRDMLNIVWPYMDDNVYMGFQMGLNFAYDRGDGGNNFTDGLNDAAMLADFDHYRSANRPFYFRFGYECNGGWNEWDPANYRPAFRRAVLAMRDEMIDAAALWNIYPASQHASGYIDGWGDYFPGNTFADWWSIDVFDNVHNLGSDTTNFLNAAHSANRPVLIGESTPRYIGADNDSDWPAWFDDHFSMLHSRTMVKGQSYIHWNWGTSRWPTWGNARLDTGSTLVRNNYLNEMGQSIWVHGGEEEQLRGAIGLAEVYVDVSARGSGSGADWENAFTSIGPALSHLVSHYGRGCLRVAEGIYSGGLTLPDGVSVYGGYPSGGGADSYPGQYTTVIDGGGTSRCVELSGTFSLLRGFTLQNGQSKLGGAALLSGQDATLYHCVLTQNSASDKGGAVYVSGDRARLGGCEFYENSATNAGGAVYLENAAESILYNSVLYANTAPSGAGVYVNGPGITLDSCTLAHHQGSGAALVASHSGSLTTVAALNNCIAAFNHPVDESFALQTAGSASRLTASNPLFHDNTNGGDYGGDGAVQVTGAVSGDPLFLEAASGDYRLSEGSPAIDGDVPPLETWLAFDRQSLERGVDGDGDSSRGYDLGAYEYQKRSTLVLDSAGGIWGFGQEGGDFSAARMAYTLYNHTDSDLSWNLLEIPDWLEADVTAGSISPGNGAVIRFAFTDRALELASGEYGPENIRIRDVTNAASINRNARLFVTDKGPRIIQLYPKVSSVMPTFSRVVVLFDEAVTGVSAEDLTVEGSPATSVTGNGTGPYVFQGFDLGDLGEKGLELFPGGITSQETGKAFSGASWQVRFIGYKAGIQFWPSYR